MNHKFTFPDTVPLRYDDTGTIRVTGSRVRLDTLVGAFQRGDTLAEIAEGFPSLSMQDVNAVIDWYLTHQTEAHKYLEQQEIKSEKVRLEIESQPGYAARREELRRRCAQLRLSKT